MNQRRSFSTLKACIAFGAALCVGAVVWGEGNLPKPVYHSYVNWPQNEITIDATVDLSAFGAMVPDAREKALRLVQNNQANMIQKTLFPVVADSFHTVGDLAASSARSLTALDNLIGPSDEQYAKMSSNLTRLTVRYQLPIFPNVGSIFVNQVKPNPPSPLLSYVPTTKFSGIVIYAKGRLPVQGENRRAELVPSLFPKIWNQNMQLIASANTIDPKVLRSRGLAAFSDNTDEKPFTSRIGLLPFHTVAVGVFGKHTTDVIISDQAADRILASPENIRLLTEGRVLIIADLPRPDVTSGG